MKELFVSLEPIIAVLIAAFAAAVCSAWGNAMIYAAQMITQAAKDTTLADGSAKMAWVVAQVKTYLPSVLATVFSDKKIQSSCQAIFDSVKTYAKDYVEHQVSGDKKESSTNG